MYTITAQDKHGVVLRIGNINPSQSGMNGNVYSTMGVSPTLTTNKGEGVKILQIPIGSHTQRLGIPIREATKLGYSIANAFDSVNLALPNSKTRRGRVGKQIANTLDTSCNQGVVIPVLNNSIINVLNIPWLGVTRGNVLGTMGISSCLTAGDATTPKMVLVRGWAIRKLMPIECLRLQAFPDRVYYQAVDAGISNSQLYKQSGNSVTVSVIRAIASIFK
ncbi:hypothetical protein HB809_09420 [Listeria booriae]|nr:hypothetical protein [Listeria booriae]